MSEARVVRAKDAIWGVIDDRIVVIGNDGLLVHVFNRTAAAIWVMCAGNYGPEEMATRLCERYDVSFEQAIKDVRDIIASMERMGLLDHADSAQDKGNSQLRRILFRLGPQALESLFSPRRVKIKSFLRRYVRHQVCQRCGRCCDGTFFLGAGLDPGEDQAIAQYLGITADEFTRKYCLEKGSQKSLKQPCPFLVKDGTLISCCIYEVRPGACRFFPLSLSKSRKAWRIYPECPVGKEMSRLIDPEQTTAATQHKAQESGA